MRLIFAGGGTGGHVFPGLSVAEAVKALRPDAEMVFLATGRPIDREVIPAAGYKLVEQSVRPAPSLRKPWQVPGFLWHWFASKRTASAVIGTPTPEIRTPTPELGFEGFCPNSPIRGPRPVVLGLGGYAAGPAIRVAAAKGIPAAILNPDVKPGRANAWAERYVREIYCQFRESARHFAGSAKIVETGCPIRSNITQGDRGLAAAEFGLDPAKRTLVVTGASQGSQSINNALGKLGPMLDRFADRWQVLHLTGKQHFEAFAPRTGSRRIAYRAVDFTTRMDLVYAVADLVVSRAGAGTLAELTAVGLPSILLPYPWHADRHQWHNAEVLVKGGAAVLLEDRIDPSANAEALAAPLNDLLQSGGKLDEMAIAARKLGKPAAARLVAERLIALAEG
jgi:UDP-N-acetylglucosamine--N-acetylmuramyl-(pentapeptide) pyrophosphoryl-undecaprenol N-acetylglucosamine transferase